MTLLTSQLAALGLHYTAETLDDLVALATKKRFSHVRLLEHIATHELNERARRSLERRVKRSKVARFKTMADFDWAWPRKIDKDAIERVLRLDFLENAGNVILVAAQGLGKTMIAKNIAHNAVVAGHAVRFASASELLLDLATTNLPFKKWSTIFPNAACTTAPIDRVVHHADIIQIEGESYRLREAEAQTASRRGRRPKATE